MTTSPSNIPAEAVEAARQRLAYLNSDAGDQLTDAEWAQEILEVAAPHLLAPVAKLADEWHEQGEELMADSKTPHMDEHISVELLKEGATMVENARHIRNAIVGNS